MYNLLNRSSITLSVHKVDGQSFFTSLSCEFFTSRAPEDFFLELLTMSNQGFETKSDCGWLCISVYDEIYIFSY